MEIYRGSIAIEVKIGKDDYLIRRFGFNTLYQFVDPEFVRRNAIYGRNCTVKHVILASIFIGSFECHYIQRILDDQYQVLSAWICADITWNLLGNVEALGAKANAILDFDDRLGQRDGIFTAGLEQVICQPTGGFRADTREL